MSARFDPSPDAAEPGGAGAARQLILAGSFTALGVVVPILFHMVGMGRYFLPMHLPVLVAGLLLRPRIAWTVGVATPWLSALLTGMPPMPMPILMGLELAALAQAASLLRAIRTPIWLASLLAVAARCGVTWVAITLLAEQLGLPPGASGWVSIVSGAPGILLQVLAVPAVAMAASLKRRLA